MIIPTIYQTPVMPNYYQPYYYNNFQPERKLEKVNGMAGAEAYQMTPNSTVALFDSDEDIMYIKSSDVSGISKIRKFHFYEEVEAEVLPPVSNPAPVEEVDADRYVTVEEFNKLREEVTNVKQSVQSTKHAKSNKSNFNSAAKNSKDDVSGYDS